MNRQTITRSTLSLMLTVLAIFAGTAWIIGQSETNTQPSENTSKQKTENSITAGKTAYVTRSEPLRKKPQPVASILTKLKRGQSVDVQTLRDNWVRVQFKKRNGWIPRSALSANPPSRPEDKSSAQERKKNFLKELKSFEPSYEQQASSDVSVSETTAGKRSLNPENEENYKKVEGSLEELKKMEKLSRFLSSDKQMNARKTFAEEGGLLWKFEQESSP